MMSYNLKYGKSFLKILFNTFSSLTIVIFSLIKHSYDLAGLWAVIAFACSYLFFKLIYLKFSKQPLLIANESFIYDRYKNIKYYWKDINEAVEAENQLDIQLYQPIKYLDFIQDPLVRIVEKFRVKLLRRKPSFSIDLGLLDIQKQAFLIQLNNYSFAS